MGCIPEIMPLSGIQALGSCLQCLCPLSPKPSSKGRHQHYLFQKSSWGGVFCITITVGFVYGIVDIDYYYSPFLFFIIF